MSACFCMPVFVNQPCKDTEMIVPLPILNKLRIIVRDQGISHTDVTRRAHNTLFLYDPSVITLQE